MDRTSGKRVQERTTERGRAVRGQARTPSRDVDVLNEHGTRVRVHATCTVCGVEKELAKAPRGKFVCADCGGREFAVPQTGEVPYTCAGCGKQGWTTRDKLEKGPVLCSDCMVGLEYSTPGRTEGSAVLDRKGGVRKKRRPTSPA